MELLCNNSREFHFYFDSRTYQGIKQIDFSDQIFAKYKARLHIVKNLYYRNHWLIWQSDILFQAFSDCFETVIFLADSTCLSTWLAAIICKLRQKRVIFWGHGFYGNEGLIKSFIRKIFYKLADQHLLYGRRGKSLMIKKGFDSKKLYIIFNSLNYDAHLKIRNSFNHTDKSKIFPFFKSPYLPIIVFIGRLTKEKKLGLLIDAVNLINIGNAKFNLLIIGGGSFAYKIKLRAKLGIVNQYIYFVGPLYDENRLGAFLATSDLCVSPGNVGLTAIHSLSLGTPVCTHGNLENQMPEAESIINGYNGFYFEQNNLESLVNEIKRWFGSSAEKHVIRSQCHEIVDKFYNPSYQIRVIDRAINKLPPEL
jgi:glycosyltransferase involved in cell wall biosynthesis